MTSDSLAARVAIRAEAAELILLKSTDWQGADWAEAGRAKVVDGYFATVIQQAPALRIRVVNLRDTHQRDVVGETVASRSTSARTLSS